MATILEIDKHQRKIISVLFRLTIVGYSSFLLFYFGTKLPVVYNILALLGYIVFFIICFKSTAIKCICRLVNDYLLIIFIIAQINELNIFTFSFLFIPILNSQNHSGDKKTPLVYIFPLLGLFLLDRENFNLWFIVPFISFYIINYFTIIREKYFLFQQELNSVIDDFFINGHDSSRPYLIYRKIIPIINRSKIVPYNIKDIVCLHIKENNESIINGSTFIWDLEIINRVDYLKNAHKKDFFINHELILNSVKEENTIIINCKIESSIYSYILIRNDENKLINNLKVANIVSLLQPILTRYSKVLLSNFNHKKNEISNLALLEDKINYVNNSVNSMHFIRNKLGPLKNYLAMVSDYEKSNEDNKKKIEPHIKKEREKLNSSMTQILEKANYVLEKSNNPFNVYQIKEYGLHQLFTEVRTYWDYNFDNQNFKMNWNITKQKTRYNVKYNVVGLELVLSNWISNMEKYNEGIYGVDLNETEDSYILQFYNSLLDNERSRLFIEEYNNSDRIEISRRNSHGLIEIKDFINQMNLESTMIEKDNLVVFSIKFKKHIYNGDINN